MKIPAVVDIKTRKITGNINNAKRHEEAHLRFNDSDLGSFIRYIEQTANGFTLIFVVLALFLDFFKWFALVFMILGLSCFIYEEVWCNYN